MDLFYSAFQYLVLVTFPHHDAVILGMAQDFRAGMELRLFVGNLDPPMYIVSL